MSNYFSEGELNATKGNRDNFALYVEQLFLLMTTHIDKYKPGLLCGESLLQAFQVR